MPDPTFDAFRRKLADAVTIAINNGVRVSASDGRCRCPIGCMNIAGPPRPDCFGSSKGVRGFAVAFDGGSPEPSEYAALGLAYRLRFP